MAVKSLIEQAATAANVPERQLIEKAFSEASSFEEAANKLGVLPNSLRYKMTQLGIKAVRLPGYRIEQA